MQSGFGTTSGDAWRLLILRKRRNIVFVLLGFLVYIPTLRAQKQVPPTTRILFILDASGSMYDNMEGRTRIIVAKDILSKLVDSLRDKPRLELALRVFGHQYDKKYNNCNDTKLEVPFKAGNHDEIIKKIKGLDPKGTTLIANSLQQAAKDFPDDNNSRNIIVLITDGIEACGGDPCAISLALQKKGIFLKPFIIGIGGNANFETAFSCMGQYFDAADSRTFRSVLDKVLTQALEKTTVRVNLLDINNRPLETNVNISFVNTMTGQTVYDFVHHIGTSGKSDILDIDPVLSYDIVVNTIPKVVKKNVFLEGGKENVIRIKSPQGTLYFKADFKEYKTLPLIVKDIRSGEILNVQHPNSFNKYLVGTYDVEILTLPRIHIRNVKIEQSKTTTLDIEPPGLLNIVERVPGYGSIYQVKEGGEQVWVCNLVNENSKTSMGLQPGKYKLVFRSKKAANSSYTDVIPFSIRSGAATNLKLFGF